MTHSTSLLGAPRGLALVTIACLATGCFRNPATGVARTGEPLRLRHASGTGSYTATEVVGEDRLYDQDGNQRGTIERTRNVRRRYAWSKTTYYQGDDPIDEQDYYRLAGDETAATTIERRRRGAARSLNGGIALALVGGVGAPLAYTLTDSTPMQIGGSLLATAAGLAGALLIMRGAKAWRVDPHFPHARAERHATEIEDCWNGRCTSRPGRSSGLTREEAAQLRPLHVSPRRPVPDLESPW